MGLPTHAVGRNPAVGSLAGDNHLAEGSHRLAEGRSSRPGAVVEDCRSSMNVRSASCGLLVSGNALIASLLLLLQN